MLDAVSYLALGVFASYFFLIAYLVDLILADLGTLYSSPNASKRSKSKLAAFVGLTGASLVHTWYCEAYLSAFFIFPLTLGFFYVDMLQYMRVRVWAFSIKLFIC